MCRRVPICKCTKFCNNTSYFCLKTKLHWKGNVQNILLYSVFFFTKFDLHNTTFQSFLSLIIRIWELFCDQLEANFLANVYSYNGKLLFRFVETSGASSGASSKLLANFFKLSAFCILGIKSCPLPNTWKQNKFE